MSHICEQDKCSGCLWKPYHSCVDSMGKQQCESSMDHMWCGDGGDDSNSGQRTSIHKTIMQRYDKHTNHKHRASKGTQYVRAAFQTGSTPAGCGTCTGCWETATTPNIGCYQWTEATCSAQGSGYQWCGSSTGGGGGGGTSINCCNSTTGVCQTLTNATTCPTGTGSIDSCTNCTTAVACANPYYGLGSSTPASCGLSTLLPNNADGLKRWLTLFPVLDPNGQLYSLNGCDASNSKRPTWGAGCTMFGQGANNGLSAFLTAAAQFPAFANGPDPKRNLVELAAFFGNVMQETSNLLYSAELNSCPGSLFGKGALQLTGAFNYVFATQGLAKPSDYNNNVTMQQGTLTGPCGGEALSFNSLGDCWATCAAATPVPPPHGSGYNLCARPWLASGFNDTTATPMYDPIPTWSSALWYWMNRPIETDIAKGFYKMQGDVSCATAHNLIQDPQYNCGEWCGVTAIAQIGCSECCIGQMSTPGAETISRVGNFVKAAAILGLPEAQGSAANSFYCMLLNTCTTGSGGASNSTCPTGVSYKCYLDGSCTDGGGGGASATSALCGNVTHAAPFPSCVAVPNNSQNVQNSDCIKCTTGIQYWPCNQTGLCQWSST